MSYYGLIMSYHGLTMSYYGLIMSYYGLIMSYNYTMRTVNLVICLAYHEVNLDLAIVPKSVFLTSVNCFNYFPLLSILDEI